MLVYTLFVYSALLEALCALLPPVCLFLSTRDNAHTIIPHPCLRADACFIILLATIPGPGTLVLLTHTSANFALTVNTSSLGHRRCLLTHLCRLSKHCSNSMRDVFRFNTPPTKKWDKHFFRKLSPPNRPKPAPNKGIGISWCANQSVLLWCRGSLAA